VTTLLQIQRVGETTLNQVNKGLGRR